VTRRTKIVATLGPASDDEETLSSMISAGVDVVRLNLSHGTIDEHLQRLERVRRIADANGRTVAVLADLPGPKVRAEAFIDGGVALEPMDAVSLLESDGSSGPAADGHVIVRIDVADVLRDLSVDDRVVLGDGAIALRVTSTGIRSAECIVETGGRVQGSPGVHLPSESSRLGSPTAADIVMARRMVDADVDFLALSFVRGRADVDALRDALAPRDVAIVAKIETSAALEKLDEIVDASNAVMVARGDLGIECPLEDVPHLQKRIVRTCVEAGVPVITATQMLESMIAAPSPTRAEVSDVANAVFDGTDAVMLSAETAIGAHPSRVIATMVRVAERAEAEADYRRWGAHVGRSQDRGRALGADPVTRAVTRAAWQASQELDVAAILCATRSGRTARAMARFRPTCLLVALSADVGTLRALALVWGVRPLAMPEASTTDALVAAVIDTALDAGVVVAGQPVIVVAGAPDRPSRAATDVMRIVTPA
jgi:pyruvate kinase